MTVSKRPEIQWEEWAQPGEPFRLVAVRTDAADWEAHLPEASRDRVARYTHGPQRSRAGASEWLKTIWLSAQFGGRIPSWTTGPHGKPLLAGEVAEWGFNLTHADCYVVAALVRGATIGVDLESTQRPAQIHAVARRVFSPMEQHQVATGGYPAFFTLWSQKEALMKAIGCGWADGEIQRQTQLRCISDYVEPFTGARIWSRPVQDGALTVAVAMIDSSPALSCQKQGKWGTVSV